MVGVARREGAADRLLEAACSALWNMTADADNLKAARASGAIEAVKLLLTRKGATGVLTVMLRRLSQRLFAPDTA